MVFLGKAPVHPHFVAQRENKKEMKQLIGAARIVGSFHMNGIMRNDLNSLREAFPIK